MISTIRLFAAFCLANSLLVAQPASALGGSVATGVEASDAGVYRVSPIDPSILGELRARHDVWGLGDADGAPYAVVWLEAQDAEALRADGLMVARDEPATAAWRDVTSRLRAAQAALPGKAHRGSGTLPGFPCYRTVEQTFADLEALAAANPTLARWIDLGDSWEKLNGPGAGYDLPALVLGNQASAAPKAPLVVIAAMHARELATAELASRFAEQLVSGYGLDPEATWLLDHREIHIVPQLNPDGRKRAEGGDFWRKNVNNAFCPGSSSRGIDLNRNSTFFWGGPASSGNACSETFRGPSPASEPETLAIEAYLQQVFPDQRGDDMSDPAPPTAEGVFLSLHSFAELVLFPWEGTNTDSPNHAGLRTLGRKFGFANGYTVCQDCLGTASGTTVDVAYGEYGAAAYTFEIGTTFFQSCADFESEILPGNLPALLFAAKAARRPYLEPAGPEVTVAAIAGGPVIAGTAVVLTATADDTRFAGGSPPEPTQAVAAVRYTIDDPPWSVASASMTAADGSFDSSIEAAIASIDTAGLAPGRHLVFVVGEDLDGNLGVPTAVFLDIAGAAPIFSDGFESASTSAWSATVP